MIRELGEKLNKLEHRNEVDEVVITENSIDEQDINTTFVNPYHSGFSCEICEFTAKTKGGLAIHMKAKHTEISKEPEIIVVETFVENEETLEILNFKCEECEFSSESSEDLEKHKTEKHEIKEHIDMNEIKLEVFILVENENDVLKARKDLIGSLSTHKEVVFALKLNKTKTKTIFSLYNLHAKF